MSTHNMYLVENETKCQHFSLKIGLYTCTIVQIIFHFHWGHWAHCILCPTTKSGEGIMLYRPKF